MFLIKNPDPEPLSLRMINIIITQFNYLHPFRLVNNYINNYIDNNINNYIDNYINNYINNRINNYVISGI